MINKIINYFKLNFLSSFSKMGIKKIVKKLKKKVLTIKNKDWQNKFPLTFFYGNGKFQPIYFFVTLFCVLAGVMLYVKIYSAWVAIEQGKFTSDLLSTSDIATVLTFISSLILLYNSNKKYSIPDLKDKEKKEDDQGN